MLCRDRLTGRFGIPKHRSADERPLGFWMTAALDRPLGSVSRVRSYSYFVVVEIGQDG